MKRLLPFVLVLVGVVANLQAENEYMPKVSGDVSAVFKIQEEHKSPFDSPASSMPLDQRAGASNRDSQFARVQGTLNVSSGIPGVTEWFAVTSLWMDGNNPDNIAGEDNANVQENKVELTNAFVMWRPFEISGGRPLGISIGQQTIKATANTAYTHLYAGDLDNDYVLHSMSALLNKPMINVDFHLNANTGIGYAFAKGASDLIQNSAAMDDDYSRTHIVYGEFGMAGFQLNAAYQYTQGNREPTEGHTTDLGNVFYTADYGFTSNSFNAQLTYDLNVANLSIKPFVGYQMLWGDESSYDFVQLNDAWKTKSANADIISGGGIVSTKIMGKKFTLSGSYNVVNSSDFNGLDGMEDGFVDYAAAVATKDYNAKVTSNVAIKIAKAAKADPSLTTTQLATMTDLTEKMYKITEYGMSDASFAGISGKGDNTYTVAGLNAMYNLEASVEMSDKVTLSFFLHGTKAKDAKTAVTAAQRTEIIEVFESLGYAHTEDPTTDTASQLADGMINEFDTGNAIGTEWTDNMSFGFAVKYKF